MKIKLGSFFLNLFISFCIIYPSIAQNNDNKSKQNSSIVYIEKNDFLKLYREGDENLRFFW